MAAKRKRTRDLTSTTQIAPTSIVSTSESTVFATSSTSKRLRQTTTTKSFTAAAPPALPIAVPPPPPQVAQDATEDPPLADFDPMAHPVMVKKPRKGPSKSVTTKMEEWLPYRESFLDEFLRLEGLGDLEVLPQCSKCDKAIADHRCDTCHGRTMMCQQCVVDTHHLLPLHKIVKWTGHFFAKVALSRLGLVIQLGHENGSICVAPHTPLDLLLFDITGVHELKVSYCYCGHSSTGIPRRTQLLRSGWVPATLIHPKTAFSLDYLDFFHKLSTQSKITNYDYYKTILHCTDNSEIGEDIYRYNEASLVGRVFTNVQTLKRSGRGHDFAGVDATTEGSLAVECAACPQPGRNLPEGWKEAPEGYRWLYTLYLAMDACFKLKLKSRRLHDPDLGTGWSYFVENSKYQTFLDECARRKDDKEINTCGSEHHAVNSAYTKFSKNFSVTGVCAVVCSRHNLVRKNSVVDLQKGEKYCNVDYALLSTLYKDITDPNISIDTIVLSYDVMCQWIRNLSLRIHSYSEHSDHIVFDLWGLRHFRVAVPKFHLIAHGISCQSTFSLNFMRGVGRTHGETIEQEWSHIGPTAVATREMGPAARHATLDDHFSAWNWRKTAGFGIHFLRSLPRAIRMSKEQRSVATAMGETYTDETLETWRAMVEAWQLDHSNPDPYAEPEASTTFATVKLEMAIEEAKDVAAGVISLHKLSQSGFLRLALDLEEKQRGLRSRGKRIKTDNQKSAIQECRNTIARSIAEFRLAQTVYMPGIAIALGGSGLPSSEIGEIEIDVVPELVPLTLPSALTLVQRDAACVPGLAFKELRLRYAQASDALWDLRRLRRMFVGMVIHHKKQTLGTSTRTNTRVTTVLKGFTARILRAADRYRAARDALVMLDPNETHFQWKMDFLVLHDDDIRGPGKDDEELLLQHQVPREGTYRPSWIWLTRRSIIVSDHDTDAELLEANQHTAMSADEVQDCMRVEWARAVARAERYEEEVQLLVHEMHRTLTFFRWTAAEWRSRRDGRIPKDDNPNSRPLPSNDILNGLHAYAERQASLREAMIARCVLRWTKVLRDNDLGLDWLLEFSPSVEEPKLLSAAVEEEEEDNADSDYDSEGEAVKQIESVVDSQLDDSSELEEALADGGDFQ